VCHVAPLRTSSGFKGLRFKRDPSKLGEFVPVRIDQADDVLVLVPGLLGGDERRDSQLTFCIFDDVDSLVLENCFS